MNNRATAGWIRILIYVFPALMDMVVSEILFVNTLRAARMGVSVATVGGIVTVWSLAYLLLCRSRLWMYRPWAAAAFSIAGIGGTIAFGMGHTQGALFAAAALFGVYSGGFFFYLVFHSLAHPSRSAQYVAINESVVGICGIAGPLLGGLMTDTLGFVYPYLAGAALIACATVFQVFVHKRFWNRPRAVIKPEDATG